MSDTSEEKEFSSYGGIVPIRKRAELHVSHDAVSSDWLPAELELTSTTLVVRITDDHVHLPVRSLALDRMQLPTVLTDGPRVQSVQTPEKQMHVFRCVGGPDVLHVAVPSFESLIDWVDAIICNVCRVHVKRWLRHPTPVPGSRTTHIRLLPQGCLAVAFDASLGGEEPGVLSVSFDFVRFESGGTVWEAPMGESSAPALKNGFGQSCLHLSHELGTDPSVIQLQLPGQVEAQMAQQMVQAARLAHISHSIRPHCSTPSVLASRGPCCLTQYSKPTKLLVKRAEYWVRHPLRQVPFHSIVSITASSFEFCSVDGGTSMCVPLQALQGLRLRVDVDHQDKDVPLVDPLDSIESILAFTALYNKFCQYLVDTCCELAPLCLMIFDIDRCLRKVGSLYDEERRLEIVQKYLLEPLPVLRRALQDAGLLDNVMSLEALAVVRFAALNALSEHRGRFVRSMPRETRSPQALSEAASAGGEPNGGAGELTIFVRGEQDIKLATRYGKAALVALSVVLNERITMMEKDSPAEPARESQLLGRMLDSFKDGLVWDEGVEVDPYLNCVGASEHDWNAAFWDRQEEQTEKRLEELNRYRGANGVGALALWDHKWLEDLGWEGLPPLSDWRGELWFALSGARVHHYEDPDKYGRLCRELDGLEEEDQTRELLQQLQTVEHDVSRLLTNNAIGITEQDSPIIDSVRRVLRAFAYVSETGYCQGMHDVAGLLLLNMSEEAAFWTLMGLYDGLFRGLSQPGKRQPGLKAFRCLVSSLLQQASPVLFEFLNQQDENLGLKYLEMVFHKICLRLMIAMFAGTTRTTIPTETRSRVLDAILLVGPAALVATLVSFLVSVQDRVMRCSELEEVLDVYDHAASRLYSPDSLMARARQIHCKFTASWNWEQLLLEFELRQLALSIPAHSAVDTALLLSRIPPQAFQEQMPDLVRQCVANLHGKVDEDRAAGLDTLKMVLAACESVAATSAALRAAIQFELSCAIQIALDAGASAVHQDPRSGVTALHLVALSGNELALSALLASVVDAEERARAVNTPDFVFGLTPLSIAAGQPGTDSTAVMKRLLFAGADPNGPQGASALFWACSAANADAVRLLLSTKSEYLHLYEELPAEVQGGQADWLSPLGMAFHLGNLGVAIRLIHHKADLNRRESASALTPLERLNAQCHRIPENLSLAEPSILHVWCAAYCQPPPLLDILVEPSDDFLQHVTAVSNQHMLLVTVAQAGLALCKDLEPETADNAALHFMERFVWSEPQRSQLGSLLQLDELPPNGMCSTHIVATLCALAVSRLEHIYASYLLSGEYHQWRRQNRSMLKSLQARMAIYPWASTHSE